MNDECLVCKAPLQYLKADELMECSICHRKEASKASCINGHYVCNECHTKGIDAVIRLCLKEKTKNPLEIFNKMASQPFCHLHGPEHHLMVGSALLTAYKNSGGEIDLQASLLEMISRGKSIPGGVCGFWGACGAGISSGIFMSIILKSTPLTQESWGTSNLMTSQALEKIGTIGGPRCCKRDSFLSILAAIDFTKKHTGITMEKSEIICNYSSKNNQCIGFRCPFSAGSYRNRQVAQNP